MIRSAAVKMMPVLWLMFLHPAFTSGQSSLPAEFASAQFRQLDNGIGISVLNQGTGPAISEGHRVRLLMKGVLADDQVFFNNLTSGKPVTVVEGAHQLVPGLEIGLSLLNGGGEALFIIPPDLGYGHKGYGNTIPPDAPLFFHVKVEDVSPRPVIIFPFDTQGKDTLQTKSGLRYIPVQPGNGMTPPRNARVTVHYTVYLPGGKKVVDSSVLKGSPFTFRLGEPGVIKGWNEAVALMSTGEKARFLIPWKLAYGKKGNPPAVPPKTDLIFDIELLKVER